METTTIAGPRIIRMDGIFDVRAAEALSRALAEAGEGEEVDIDLTHVREFHDFGVTVLARAMAGRGARVAVRGLRQHQLRLLRYLGIDAGASALGRTVEAN